MSTVDTSTWNPDPALNESIGDIPLNSNASIAQTWQAIQMLMAAGGLHGLQLVTFDGATASADGKQGLVPAPEAGDQDKVLKGDGTWGTVAAANHTHGNITSDGKVGTASGKPLITGTDGAVQAGDFGSTSGTFCEGSDSRLSDARTPVSHAHDGTEVVLTGYSKPSSTSAVAAADTLNAAVGKLEKAMDSKVADSAVVHLSGNETVGGAKTFSSEIISSSSISLRRSDKTSSLLLAGGDNAQYPSGAKAYLYGGSHSSQPGEFLFQAGKTSMYKQLVGKPDGTLTWDGNAIQTSSDERLKTSLETVPDAVLDAWGDVRWGQFRFLDALSAKGGRARLHLGLVAQRVKAVFESRGLDACSYGILCHEEREAAEEEPAADLWMVRYAEALAMEAACQRRRADRLETRIAALEERLNG